MNKKAEHTNSQPRQSTIEYLRTLEIEWWIHNLRRKIYNDPSLKRNFEKISKLKRNRIIEICQRIEIPSIFSDGEQMKALNKKFASNGCPTFRGITDEDVNAYYSVGSEVRCCLGIVDSKPIIKIGKIEAFDFQGKKVTITMDEISTNELQQESVSRIF